jgi:hypothetical protein
MCPLIEAAVVAVVALAVSVVAASASWTTA